MGRKKLVITSVSWRSMLSAEGEEIYLDEYETREGAEDALFDLVLQHVDYDFDEIEE